VSSRADFDAGAKLEQLRTRRAGRTGAIVSFTGPVRDPNDGAAVLRLVLEHYPGMTEKALETIAAHAMEHWRLVDAIIIHRVGPLVPNDRIVFVAAACTHRRDAFRACAYMIDTLKKDAPFWKQEDTPHGRRRIDAIDR
jgi:molybdopterin synthase catalytic subunit